MPRLELTLSRDEFRGLPRHAAYKYTYLDGVAHLNPRPRYCHAWLRPRDFVPEFAADVPVRPFTEADWDPCAELFAEAFAAQQPFAGLPASDRLDAARASLEQTRQGGDGPRIDPASFVATTTTGAPVGAVLVTLVPLADPTEWGAYVWHDPPPSDAVARQLGRAHLTWIFVRGDDAGRGVGTALLGAACRALAGLGFDELHSTFLVGNESSTLWHWRSGFRLLSYPGSRRLAP
jgi:hypothetical protein